MFERIFGMASATRLKTSAVVSRRKVNRSKDMWLDFFQDALSQLLATDNESVKELTEEEAGMVVRSAELIADKALETLERRFPDA